MSVHATIVAIGEAGVMLRGASGAGKSRLAQALISAGRGRGLFARLVADDRAVLSRQGGRLIARAPASIKGMIEERGTGLLTIPHEEAAVLRCVVDIAQGGHAPRLPGAAEAFDEIQGVALARLQIDGGLGPEEASRRILDKLARK